MALFGKNLTIWQREKRDGYIFISPFLIGFVLFSLIPIGFSIYLAFTRWNIIATPQWVGLKNFLQMFNAQGGRSRTFYKSLGVTSYYVFLSLPLEIIWAISLALLLRRQEKGQRVYVTFFYLPSVRDGWSR